MKKILGMLLIVTACCSQEERMTIRDAQAHAEKLRAHFKGYVSNDVSTLVIETQFIANRLKAFKFNKLANNLPFLFNELNKITLFCSYFDVLMYGNNTLNESVRDTQELVIKGVNPCDYKQCLDISSICGE